MLVFQDHPHLQCSFSEGPNKSSEFEVSLSELNKSGSSVSTHQILLNHLKCSSLSSDGSIASCEKEIFTFFRCIFNNTF